MMRVNDVLEILTRLEAANVAVWLDGGWGVDALLGEQTRPHDDLDVVMAAVQLDAARDALRDLGFVAAVDELPIRCVLRDAGDRRIDVHPVTFDREGGGLQQQPDGSAFRYPPEGLTGTGAIAGRPVRCLTPELQVRCHLAYEPDANDIHDLLRLCERFGLALPRLRTSLIAAEERVPCRRPEDIYAVKPAFVSQPSWSGMVDGLSKSGSGKVKMFQ